MRNIPISAAEQFCNEYKKDQVIILSWDKKSNETWVTTYGIGDNNSIQAANGGNAIKDFLQLKREANEIPERFKKWEIESVDRYWHLYGRNGEKYVETTFWYEPHTLERKETTRIEIISNEGERYALPEWAKSITERRRSLESYHF
jgi:hypothetical protein